MRVAPDIASYTWITIQDAGKRLGGLTDEHVLGLGKDGLLDIVDLRREGAKRGVYRVNPESVAALIEKRRVGTAA